MGYYHKEIILDIVYLMILLVIDSKDHHIDLILISLILIILTVMYLIQIIALVIHQIQTEWQLD